MHTHTRTYTFGPYKTMAQTCVNDADSGGENQFSEKTIYKCKYRGVLSHIAVSYFTRKHTDEFVKRNHNVAVDATQNANRQTIQMSQFERDTIHRKIAQQMRYMSHAHKNTTI